MESESMENALQKRKHPIDLRKPVHVDAAL